MMSSCCTLRLKRRRALSSVSPSCTVTSAKLSAHPTFSNSSIVRDEAEPPLLTVESPSGGARNPVPADIIGFHSWRRIGNSAVWPARLRQGHSGSEYLEAAEYSC